MQFTQIFYAILFVMFVQYTTQQVSVNPQNNQNNMNQNNMNQGVNFNNVNANPSNWMTNQYQTQTQVQNQF